MNDENENKNTIDLSKYSTTLDKVDFSKYSITVDDSWLNSSLTMNTATSPIDLTSYTYSTSSNWGNSGGWSTGTSTGTVNIDSKGIDIKDSGDIKIGHRSMKEFMDKMEQRLAILQPDPELLEKFEALRQAYEHYKTLEALCMGDIPKRTDGK